MSLRSTDMRDLIPKVAEVSRIQQIRDQRPQVAVQQQSDQFVKQLEQQKNQVPRTPQTEHSRIQDYKDKRRGNSRKGKNSDGRETQVSYNSSENSSSEPGDSFKEKGKLLDVLA